MARLNSDTSQLSSARHFIVSREIPIFHTKLSYQAVKDLHSKNHKTVLYNLFHQSFNLAVKLFLDILQVFDQKQQSQISVEDVRSVHKERIKAKKRLKAFNVKLSESRLNVPIDRSDHNPNRSRILRQIRTASASVLFNS
jgi:hypothetical protein